MPQRYGLLGWPVNHSVSPQMQGAGFAACGLDATYELLPVHPDDLAAKVTWMKAEGFRGWNITVPHKGGMFELADEVSPAARHAESVNTILHDNGVLRGFSTDGYGLEMAIQEAFGTHIQGGEFIFWGTGGAARATAIHFALEGANTITLVNRTLSKAEDLATKLKGIAPGCDIRVYAPTDLQALQGQFHTADTIIQCTSIGLKADDPISIPESLLKPGYRILDMIYHPTRLLKVASKNGCNVADGRAMLLHQGVKSFSIWTDGLTPVEAMREGLDQALDS